MAEPEDRGDSNVGQADGIDLGYGRLREILSLLDDEVRNKLSISRKAEHFYVARAITDSYEKELIQLSACGLHALADYYASTEGYSPEEAHAKAIAESQAEMERQAAKFGAIPRYLDPMVWLAVIGEELAETAQECLDIYPPP